ncbi:MAG TPA: PASTA domain-containing protein [Candidatus Acidoferrales bacterium]|nr:PASTA domain-containing protein [Candidatus Acidoferrales bacterium]
MMEFRERMEWLLHLGLLVFILAAAAFLSAITTIRIAIRSSEVQMPSLVGKSMADAQNLLRQRGLGLKVADRVYDALPAGSVVRQTPPANSEVKSSQAAHVVISLGPMKVTIPQLEGLSLRAARIAVLQTGLQLGEVSAPYLDNSQPDSVLVQAQLPNTQATSPRVDVLSPLGPRPGAVVMPFFIGLSEGESQRQLTSVGVKNIKSTPVPAAQWPIGTVMDQSPSPGSRVALDGFVELKVAAPAPPDIHDGND